MRFWERLVATGLGSGYLPVAPATFGSMLALLIWVYLVPPHEPLRAALIVSLFFYGVYVSGVISRRVEERDPREVVVDEVCAMWIVLWLTPGGAWSIAGFFAFRIFDVLKPPPVRHAEFLSGGWGIMLDDLLAAVYSVVSIQALFWISRLFG